MRRQRSIRKLPWLRWTAVAFLVPTLPILAAYLAGARLPIEHRQQALGLVAAPPARVWDLLTDVPSQPNWRTGLKRVLPSDITTRRKCWVELPVIGSRLLCIAEQQPISRRAVDVLFAVPDFHGTWTFELAPTPPGTLVTITEHDTLPNPLTRFFSRRLMKEDPALYLHDLQTEAVRTR